MLQRLVEPPSVDATDPPNAAQARFGRQAGRDSVPSQVGDHFGRPVNEPRRPVASGESSHRLRVFKGMMSEGRLLPRA